MTTPFASVVVMYDINMQPPKRPGVGEKFCFVKADPSGMNFGLPCSGGHTDTCNNGLHGSWQHDQDGNKTTFDAVSIGNKDGPRAVSQLTVVDGDSWSAMTLQIDGKFAIVL